MILDLLLIKEHGRLVYLIFSNELRLLIDLQFEINANGRRDAKEAL